MSRRFLITTIAVALTASAGCATTSSDGRPRTAMERARGQCGMALLVGAIAGPIIGNNTGNGSARDGLVAGVGVGLGICAVLTAMASQEDKRRIAELEYEAAEAGERRETEYIGSDGRRRSIVVVTAAAEDPNWPRAASAADVGTPASGVVAASQERPICRTRQTSLAVEGVGSGSLASELICRNPQTRAWEVRNA